MLKTIQISAFFFLLLLNFCTPPEIDYNEINNLIAQHKYEQAIQEINQYKESTSNLLEKQKLEQLYITADKALLFADIRLRLRKGDTLQLKTIMDSIFKNIQTKDSLAQRWYYFDYYFNQAQYYALKNDSAQQVDNLLKATTYPVKEIRFKINVFIDLAFHYAELGEFEKAREWLDKALRSFDKDEHKGLLLDVYIAYMNGDYSRADSILTLVPQENKNLNWQRIETFFNLYLKSLTLKNRFKLW